MNLYHFCWISKNLFIYVSYWSVECQIQNQKAKYIAYRLQKDVSFFLNPQKSQAIGFDQTSFLFNVCLFCFLQKATRRRKCRSQKKFRERLGVDITIKFIIIVWMNPMEIQSLGIGMVVWKPTHRMLRLPKKARKEVGLPPPGELNITNIHLYTTTKTLFWVDVFFLFSAGGIC